MTADSSGHVFLAVYVPEAHHRPSGRLNIYSGRGAKVVQSLNQAHVFFLPILDSFGSLFTMCAAARVCEYAAAGNQKVLKQRVIRRIALGKIPPLTHHVDGAHDFATDSSGDLAINRGGTVQVFAPGETAPYWSISPQTLDGMTATAFDSKGDLYLALRCVEPGYDGAVLEYAPGSSIYPIRNLSTLDGVVCPDSVKVDTFDNLYVLGGYTHPNVTVFPPTGDTLLRTMTEGIVEAQGHVIALDSLGDVYVSNSGVFGSDPGSVVVYPAGGSTPIRTVTKGMQNPQELATGP
ncbi:MAG: hypothetical protein WB615_11225 [Candidatus Tumulicola sp.]